MINRVIVVGRLTRDPEMRTTTTGKSVADFGIAVTKRVKPEDGPDADFFRVNCWNQTAEFVCNYLHKGRLVAVDGRLQSRKFTTNDGQTREVVEIVADSVQGLDKPREEDAPEPVRAYGSTVPSADEYDPFFD